MLSNPELLFSVNQNSIEYMFDLIVEQGKGFAPKTKEVLKELVKVELKEIPFDGTITERNKFINDTVGELIQKYVDEKRLKIIEE